MKVRRVLLSGGAIKVVVSKPASASVFADSVGNSEGGRQMHVARWGEEIVFYEPESGVLYQFAGEKLMRLLGRLTSPSLSVGNGPERDDGSR